MDDDKYRAERQWLESKLNELAKFAALRLVEAGLNERDARATVLECLEEAALAWSRGVADVSNWSEARGVELRDVHDLPAGGAVSARIFKNGRELGVARLAPPNDLQGVVNWAALTQEELADVVAKMRRFAERPRGGES